MFERSRRPEPDARTSRFEPSSHLLGPPGRRRFVLSYKGIQGGFEQLWMSGAGSAEESWVLKRHDQECVDASLPPTKYPFPLPNPLISPVTSQQGRFAAYLSLIPDLGAADHLHKPASHCLRCVRRGDRRRSLRDRQGAGRLFGLVYALYWRPLSPDRGDRPFRDTWIRSPKMNSRKFRLGMRSAVG